MPQSCRKIWNIPRLSDEVENYNLLVQLPAGVLLRARKPVYARLVFASENTNQISNSFWVPTGSRQFYRDTGPCSERKFSQISR